MAAHLQASRFFGWMQAREQKPEVDAADLGTAFGLEVSLADCEWLPRRTRDANGADDELPEPPRF